MDAAGKSLPGRRLYCAEAAGLCRGEGPEVSLGSWFSHPSMESSEYTEGSRSVSFSQSMKRYLHSEGNRFPQTFNVILSHNFTSA